MIPDKPTCRPLRAAWDLAPSYPHSCISELTFTLCLSTYISSVLRPSSCLMRSSWSNLWCHRRFYLPHPSNANYLAAKASTQRSSINCYPLRARNHSLCSWLGSDCPSTERNQSSTKPTTWHYLGNMAIQLDSGDRDQHWNCIEIVFFSVNSTDDRLAVLRMCSRHSSTIHNSCPVFCSGQMVDASFEHVRNQWLHWKRDTSKRAFQNRPNKLQPRESTRTGTDLVLIDYVVMTRRTRLLRSV